MKTTREGTDSCGCGGHYTSKSNPEWLAALVAACGWPNVDFPRQMVCVRWEGGDQIWRQPAAVRHRIAGNEPRTHTPAAGASTVAARQATASCVRACVIITSARREARHVHCECRRTARVVAGDSRLSTWRDRLLTVSFCLRPSANNRHLRFRRPINGDSDEKIMVTWLAFYLTKDFLILKRGCLDFLKTQWYPLDRT